MTDHDVERFLSLIRPLVSGCWEWLGTRGHHSYGRICFGAYKPGARRLAHRVSYEYFIGPIAEGLHIDHLCRHPWCVNPLHLEPVTCGENIRRGLTGQYAHSPEHNAKTSASKIGKARPWTPEWRAKIADALHRRTASQTVCKRGHPYTAANTVIHQGSRSCRLCRRDATERYRERRRRVEAA